MAGFTDAIVALFYHWIAERKCVRPVEMQCPTGLRIFLDGFL